MKIGIVCPYNVALPGGVQQHVFEQAKELRQLGHEVKVITPKPRGKVLTDDAEIIFLGTSARIKTPQHTSVDVSVSVTPEAIDDLLDREKFDVIHMHEPLVPLLARQMLPRLRCPVVGTFHAAIPETVVGKSIAGSISPFIKSIVKHLNAVTAVSKPATSYIGNYVNEKDIYLIPNGVDIDSYSEKNTNRKRSGVLYVGRLEKRKGVAYLISAFAKLLEKQSKIKLTIAGDGPDKTKLQKQCAELGITDNVEFVGYVSESEKKNLLHNCALFVSPALYGESFGIVLIEAMAAGAVVVGGNNAGYASVLSGRGAISLVNPLDDELFASRMNVLLNDEDLRTLWRAWAKNEVQQYSYKKIVASYQRIYKELV